jgi:hypothetical protein
MAICGGFVFTDHVPMTGSTMTAPPASLAARRLEMTRTVRRSDAADRTAVRRVREARRKLQASSDRFAHLKRMYD